MHSMTQQKQAKNILDTREGTRLKVVSVILYFYMLTRMEIAKHNNKMN